MIRLRATASDDEVIRAVRRWVDLLATDRYEVALEQVRAREHWTVALLRTVIASYGSPEPRPGHAHRVSRVAEVSGDGQSEVLRFAPLLDASTGETLVGAVQVALPLDGSWSDLTAVFDLVAVDGGLELRLDDIHVL